MILKLKWCLIVSANHTRFTKRHFVRHKNTQKLEEAYIIQFLLLSLNMGSDFKFIQRNDLQMAANFHFSSRILLMNFLFIPSFIPNCRKFRRSTQPYVRWFCFHLLVIFVFIVWLTDWCGAKITQNEKLKYKIKRWMDFKMDTLFLLRMKNQII